ncbi:hypothetical protein HQ576_14575, partial [bacterium]|nr:hypothetical protein [bacterium]
MKPLVRHAGKVLACLVSAAFIALAVRGVDWSTMGEAFRGARYSLVVL